MPYSSLLPSGSATPLASTNSALRASAEDMLMWNDWNWTSAAYFQEEMFEYLMQEYEKDLAGKRGNAGTAGGGGGGCCLLQ